MQLKKLVALAVIGLFTALAGCANVELDKQTIGTALGVIGGGALGATVGGHRNKTALTIAGAVAGGIAGGAIGKNMDQQDRDRAARFTEQSLNQPRPGSYHDGWQSPSGAYVQQQVQTKTAYVDRGRNCRPFKSETTVRIEGQPQVASREGVACFEYSDDYPQGTWVIQGK